MMKRKLTESVSLQELQQMREDGMTNRQIAEALEVGYSTVCKYLGRQPQGLRAERGTYSKPDAVIPVTEEKKPVLRKLSCVEEFIGDVGRYIVRRDMGIVTIKPTTSEDTPLDKEKLELYITELLDILSML